MLLTKVYKKVSEGLTAPKTIGGHLFPTASDHQAYTSANEVLIQMGDMRETDEISLTHYDTNSTLTNRNDVDFGYAVLSEIFEPKDHGAHWSISVVELKL